MPATIAEKKLVYQVIKNRDPQAFAALYDLYVGKIYRFIFFKVSKKEDAEDLTSDVFLKTWQYLAEKTDREVKSFSGLIYQVARNVLVDWYRLRASRPETPLDLAPEISVDEKAFAALDVNQAASEVLKVVRQLKQEYQEIILLRYIEELSIKEISHILKKSPVSVRVTLHRAITVLKKALHLWTSSSTIYAL